MPKNINANGAASWPTNKSPASSDGWINADERLPEVGPGGQSELVQFEAGEVDLGWLIREADGLFWWNTADGRTQVPEVEPKGIAHRRFVSRWRRAPAYLW